MPSPHRALVAWTDPTGSPRSAGSSRPARGFVIGLLAAAAVALIVSAGLIGVRPVVNATAPATAAATHTTHGALHPLSSAIQHVRPQADLVAATVAVVALALMAFGALSVVLSVTPRRTRYRFASRAPPHSIR
jgi:ABC-type nitrate/sulfonate/bicarbonate transport system permease component